MEGLCSTSIDKASDSELVAATKFGNLEAFERLFARHGRRVLTVAQRILNNREDAEDVLQESFHKAFTHMNTFQEKSRFSTWLTRIAMNEAFMLLRKRRRILEVSHENPDDGGMSEAATFVDQSPNPEQSCWHGERARFLNGAISRLTPTLRKTILLYDIDGRSAKETAQILGTTISAVKSRINHGHQKLRANMNPGFGFGKCAGGTSEAQCS
jgi:RNA polymerase sigma-70 factor, ECF subfamily